MLVSDGYDIRKLPLSMRKTNLARLLARRVDGIHLAPFEQGEIGPDLFRHACLMGLEGLVSNKNRQHPAFSRVMDQFACGEDRHRRYNDDILERPTPSCFNVAKRLRQF